MTSRASRKVASPRVVCIEDLRPLARRRVPKAVFDYLDGGAEGEVTLRENCRAFEDVTFRPRHAVSIPDCDLRTRVLGFDLSLPFLLAPVGYSRLMHPGGEVAAARAAGKAGTAYILSTISGHKLEDVKAGSSGPVFDQLYLMGGRAAAEAVIERARVARFAGLVVTIDTPVSGIRERDYRNGMKELLSGSLLEKIPFLPQVLSSPLRGRGITYHSPVQTFSSRAVGNGGRGLRCALAAYAAVLPKIFPVADGVDPDVTLELDDSVGGLDCSAAVSACAHWVAS